MTDATAPSAPAPDKAGLLDDFVDVITSPTQVFVRRQKAGFGAALVVVWIALSGLSLAARPVLQPIMEAEMQKAQAKAMASNPNITQDQMAVVQKIGGIVTVVGMLVAPPIAMLVLGVFVWLVGKIFGATLNAGQGVLIATFAFIPRIIGSLLILVQTFVLDSSKVTSAAQISFGPARLLDASSIGATMLALLTRFDVFVIWSTVLIAIGYMAVGKLQKGPAYAAAAILWLLATAPAVLGAMRAG